MRVLTLAVLTCFLLTLPTAARAADTDAVQAKLDKAKRAYERDLKAAADELLEQLAEREKADRRDGNKKAVDHVKAESRSFKENGDLPRTVPTQRYGRKVLQSRKALVTAYRAAV